MQICGSGSTSVDRRRPIAGRISVFVKMCDLVAGIPPPELNLATCVRGRTRGLNNGVTLEVSGATDVGVGERKEPQGRLTENAKPEEAVSPEPAEAATDNTPNSSDRLVEREPQPADQSVADMTVPEHSAKMGSRAQGKVDLERLVDAAGPRLSDGADFTATPTREPLIFPSSKKKLSGKQKRSQEAGVVKSVEVFPPLQTSIPTFSDEVQRLDEEIRLLRDQLARKLQLQNTRLRMMLERFDR